jgi:recombination protein RecR
MEGVTAEQLTLNELSQRVKKDSIEEVIIALEHNMEGEATTRHIISYLKNVPVSVTRLARGLPTGGDIEFADALTLNAAFSGRTKI